MNGIEFLMLAGIATASTEPSLEDIEKSLWSTSVVHVTGEYATFNYATPPRATQHTTFDVKFDRASKRLRITLDVAGRQDETTHAEVWGEVDCLNMVSASGQAQGFWAHQHVECAKLSGIDSRGHLTGLMPVLQRLLDGAVLQAREPGKRSAMTAGARGIELAVSTHDGHVLRRAWFTADGSAMLFAAYGDLGGGTRLRLETHAGKVRESDWVYEPTAEQKALARVTFETEDAAARADLEKLAKQGSRDAQLALGFRTVAPLMMGFNPRNTDIEVVWGDLERMANLGVTMAIAMQGRLLAYAKTGEQLPAKLRGLSEDERIKRGKALMWRAAELCDNDTLEDMSKSYGSRMPGVVYGRTVFEPNVIKASEVARLTAACNEKAYGPRLRAAENLFADPWPSGS